MRMHVRALATTVETLVKAPAGTTGLEGTIIQLFFGYKVYIMSGRNKPVFGLIIVLATVSLGKLNDYYPTSHTYSKVDAIQGYINQQSSRSAHSAAPPTD
ncbi:hypothetical protein CPB85DRAFT_1443400 [Mucidula mucida]|nr:hypothetical protein CPB85DRAFT_1443400 [Mucidula mucida]